MKIVEIHTQNLGAVPNGKLSFVDNWTGETEKRILFTGINGCGKSTLLRAIAMMWEALGYWLEHQKILPTNYAHVQILEQTIFDNGGIAIILDNVKDITGNPHDQIGLVFGRQAWFQKIKSTIGNKIHWIGEVYDDLMLVVEERAEYFQRKEKFQQNLPFYFPEKKWLEMWSHKRKALMISDKVKNSSNMMYLDSEERRWVSPKHNIGEYYPDLVSQRWLAKYVVSTDWRGQLEASLINLKILDNDEFCRVIDKLNFFLKNKQIEKQVATYSNRIMVHANHFSHYLDELSSGEHQVLIMLFLTLRWLQKGGIILIDEPDLYLHPSLVQGFLATLEHEADTLDAQIIITSHSDDVWKRYEHVGVRIDMSEGKYHVR